MDIVEDREPVNILVVDDRPDKLLAIEVALEGLDLIIVKAESGREALRRLLGADFAVILLDVNMPGMDGFETARLIRQRKSCEHVPIIFITAFGDDVHVAQGYSLGAVDYILTPIVPDVLRTKVMVFLELFKKNREISRQARHQEQRARLLNRLNDISLAIHSASSIDRIVALAADAARELTGSQKAVLKLDADQTGKPLEIASPRSALRFTSDHNPGRAQSSQAALGVNGAERGNNGQHRSGLSAEIRFSVPLVGRDRSAIGSLAVFGQEGGQECKDFNDDDRALLLQLAQMTAVAIENTLFAEAREANRIKDEFLATLSHELRTPLTAILGWTQLLRLKGTGSEDAEHGLAVIERNIGAQTKLIDDLLDISRITTGKLRLNMQEMDLRSVVQNAVDAIRPAMDAKQIQLSVALPDVACPLNGDPDRLQQVVWNLLSNSLKFTPPSGQIDVQLRQTDLEFELDVRDTGIGIHPNFMPHIFDRFRQADSSTRRRHSGLGIGLALVRHVVEQHKGVVAAHSAGEGQGTTFLVRIPKTGAHPAEGPYIASRPHCSKAEGENVDLHHLRILLVEDEMDAREMVRLALERFGGEVAAVASAAEAIDSLMQSRPDVVVSDIGMPEMDGYDLMRAIQEMFPTPDTLPAIALSAFARPDDQRRALAAGFSCHVAKPVEPALLAATISRLAKKPRTAGGPPLPSGKH